MDRCTPVDQKNRQRPDLSISVGAGEVEQPRMAFEDQPSAGALGGGTFRNYDATTASVRHRDTDGLLSRRADPLDKWPFLLFALAIFAGPFAFIGKEQIFRQRRFGVVVAPRHADLDLSDVGRQQDGEPDGGR